MPLEPDQMELLKKWLEKQPMQHCRFCQEAFEPREITSNAYALPVIRDGQPCFDKAFPVILMTCKRCAHVEILSLSLIERLTASKEPESK
jgi:hypothetical protein